MESLFSQQCHSKVIVVYGLSKDIKYVTPPGPDFIIITVVLRHSDTLSDLQKKKFTHIDECLDYIRKMEAVEYIAVNSTLGWHIGNVNTKPIEDPILLSGGSNRKALLICNTHGRDGWELEYDKACCVFQQLGLKVEVKKDLGAKDMCTAISDFSKSSRDCSLIALAILSHGDGSGGICGNDGISRSVKKVVNKLCRKELKDKPKIVFLSFCRGKLGEPKANRTAESSEFTAFKGLVNTEYLSFRPFGTPMSQKALDTERGRHRFPFLAVPVNCYLCFSTLPDSKSSRFNRITREYNWMFQGMSKHLTDLYRGGHLAQTEHRTHGNVNFAPVDEHVATTNSDITEQDADCLEASSVTLHCPPPSAVELISLFTDVSGLVREESGFTQYMNYCYTLNKESKPVKVKISDFQGRGK